MNLVQKTILSITVPLVILALAIGVILSMIGGFVTCPMMMGYSGTQGILSLSSIGFILAIALLMIGFFEFWLFRDRPKEKQG